MYYVGIDVAKDKHYVCILDDTRELAVKPFWIYSDILGLRDLIKRWNRASNTTNHIKLREYLYLIDNTKLLVLALVKTMRI